MTEVVESVSEIIVSVMEKIMCETEIIAAVLEMTVSIPFEFSFGAEIIGNVAKSIPLLWKTSGPRGNSLGPRCNSLSPCRT